MTVHIREMREDDWSQVSAIYKEGIETNLATFQIDSPSYADWDKEHISGGRFAALNDGEIIGWAALSPVSSRCVYAGVAEVSVYIGNQFHGKGAGALLLTALIDWSEKNGIWTLQSGIMQNNPASIRLREKCGFRMVGFREKIGKDRFGVWRNTVLMKSEAKTLYSRVKRELCIS
ncbi:GNAT family N-acetyltransferase [Breznakiella homolactica]|uniref:N-acetyltransferase n=1 Tax=Breznakiella homolactica TaxID=2798577 RepID=A0A7T8B9U6_9SPIR|nr:GNAT family N-acetyltransferase [Breznakiella homolactica]QQO07563.1 GNAT family N-acetyltransferase [Breznakiella homolactica]